VLHRDGRRAAPTERRETRTAWLQFSESRPVQLASCFSFSQRQKMKMTEKRAETATPHLREATEQQQPSNMKRPLEMQEKMEGSSKFGISDAEVLHRALFTAGRTSQ
jgi:hypothetical protein